MISLNTNTAALVAQQYLNINNASASEAIAQISSGSRVRPADDASSLAISNLLSADIAALRQAGQNASQGSSLLQVANGAYSNIGQMLARMKTLATEINNGSLGDQERQYANQEFTSLRDQITQTATQTRWNGQSLLTGGAGATNYAQEGESQGLTANTGSGFAGTVVIAASSGSVSAAFGSSPNVTVTNGVITVTSTSTSGGPYTVTVQIGQDSFQATDVNPSANGTVSLVDQTNSSNELTLNFGPSVAGITDTNTFQSELGSLLGGQTITVGDQLQAINLQPANAVGFQTAVPLFDQANSQGFVNGAAKSVNVTQDGNAYDISVVIGNQTFLTKGFAPNASTTSDASLTLVSSSDPGNIILINQDVNSAAVLTSPSVIQTSLTNLLGLGTGESPASFQSSSAVVGGFNGFATGGLTPTIHIDTSVPAGAYAVAYDATSQTFKLTDDVNVYTAQPQLGPNNANQSGPQVVSFGNGVSLNLGPAFNTGVSIGQTLFSVGNGTEVNMTFQVAEKSTDVANISFQASTADALNLVTDPNGNPINLLTVANAATASAQIDVAINEVNKAQANLGALQSRFDFVQSTLSTTVENTLNAKSTFYDADIAAEQTNYTRASTLQQASISMLAQANQLPQALLKLLQ